MKKTLLLIAFSFALTSCVAQELVTEPNPPLIANFIVVTICDGNATLYSSGKRWIVQDKGFIAEKEYLMKIRQGDCLNCFKRHAQVLGFQLSTKQIEQDQRKMIRSTANN